MVMYLENQFYENHFMKTIPKQFVELLSTNYFIFYITIKITMDGNETILSQK